MYVLLTGIQIKAIEACWVCGKFTTAVLTSNDKDWFYVCLNHISDPSFCKPVAVVKPPATTPAVQKPSGSATSLKEKKVDEEEKKSEASSKTDTKGKTEADAKRSTQNLNKGKKKETEKLPETPEPPLPQTTGPKEYILDSKIFFMREDACKKKLAAKKAQQLTAQMPTVPRKPLPPKQ